MATGSLSIFRTASSLADAVIGDSADCAREACLMLKTVVCMYAHTKPDLTDQQGCQPCYDAWQDSLL